MTGRRARRRPGLGALELLLALGAALLVMGLAGAVVSLVGRSGARAAWSAEAERKLESAVHVLRGELERANHLIAREPGTGRLHDPRLSAVWVIEDGKGIAFRCFANDQEVADPADLDPESLVQDRVRVVLRGRELVFLRRGRLSPAETRVLLTDVDRVAFVPIPGKGPGGGLELEVVLGDARSGLTVARKLGFGLHVPALVEEPEAAPAPGKAPARPLPPPRP